MAAIDTASTITITQHQNTLLPCYMLRGMEKNEYLKQHIKYGEIVQKYLCVTFITVAT